MNQDIVVVGIACRFARSRDVGEFWRALESGKSDIKPVGSDNWDVTRFYDAGNLQVGTINTRWIGGVEDVRSFDHAFFNLSPREAVAMDPQHRMLLEEAWHCIEDSGLPVGVLQSGRTSVNVGLMAQDYLIKEVSNNKRVDAFDPIGNYACIAANRISYLLDLTGPSRTVDTACSASLAALAQGRGDLLHESCDFALVGGVNVVCSPWRYLAFTQSRMLSPDGRCFTFDRRANGYVPGEGAGMVLMTTRDRAERLGCHVYGVVKSVATNHNGHNRNLTAPSLDAQVDVIRRALAEAGVDAPEVDYVEAHGTGTSLGDPIEIDALACAYGSDRRTPLQVGSVKTNIGHVEAGAGMAGLIKVLLMLRHGRIVPTLNCEVPSPLLSGVGECIEFPDCAVDWAAREWLRTAGVSSFGFGGVNCHAVIQEYRTREIPAEPEIDINTSVFTVAAKTRNALVATLAAWTADPRWEQDAAVAQLCRASNQRRLNLPYRVGARARDLPQLLAAVRRGEEPPGLEHVIAPPRPVVLLAPHSREAARGAVEAATTQHPELSQAAGRAAELGLLGELDRFALHVGCLETLAEQGVIAAELIAVDKSGAAAALVHAEAITFDNAVDVLLGGDSFTLCTPPRCTVVIGRKRLLPNEFTDSYLQGLLDSCAQTPEAVAPCAGHAAVLVDHQHTFARALGRWEQLLSSRGLALFDVLREFDQRAATLTPTQLTVTALAVAVALTEIDRAWHLRPARWMDSATAELAGLICEDIIDRGEVVAVLYGEIGLAELTVQARSHDRVRGDRLDTLAALAERTRIHYRDRLLSAPNPDEATAAAHAAMVISELSSAPVVVVGPLVGEVTAEVVHIAGGADDLAAGLLELWLRGHDIQWAGSQLDVPVRPTGLPGYRFDRNPFWHEDTDLRIDGGSAVAAAGTDSATGFRLGVAAAANGHNSAGPDVRGRLEGLLADLIAEATHLPRETLRPHSEFADLGVDSLIIHHLNTELSARLGDIAVTLFFECRTIREVAERIHRDCRVAVEAHFDSVVGETMPVVTAASGLQPGPKAAAPSRSTVVRLTKPPDAARECADDGIAVIGFDGRFPGADSIEEFWANLCDGIDSVTEIPSERWDHTRFYHPHRHIPGKVYAKWGGFLSDIDRFDAASFGISPVEAMFMDPQERLFVEAAHGCFESAGYTRERLRGGEVGVFVGTTFNNYQLVQHDAATAQPDPYTPINSQSYAIANRVSYLNDLRGPSMTVDTACSSSLHAVHLACESLRRGECAVAMAGGVNLTLHPSKYQMLAQYEFLSSDGRCRAFGAGGDGYVPAETVGAFLLKRVADAARDRDRIYGVIRGSALTHGGRTNGFTVPSPNAHAAAIRRALNQAGWGADTVSYFEAHGTGTRLGDPVEVAAIGAAYQSTSSLRQHCAIGSVKSNIGHAEAAAGVAQLMKVVLQLQHRTLVPSLHAEPANPAIDFVNSPVYVQREYADWDPATMGLGDIPRRAGVSSIGAGGSNVHLVIEEYRP